MLIEMAVMFPVLSLCVVFSLSTSYGHSKGTGKHQMIHDSFNIFHTLKAGGILTSRDNQRPLNQGVKNVAGVECCPSVIEMVEPRGGQTHDDQYVELYRDGKHRQRFNEISCHPAILNKACWFINKKLHDNSRCMQEYSYTYALVHAPSWHQKELNYSGQNGTKLTLDYIKVRSGCSCVVKPTIQKKRHKNKNQNSTYDIYSNSTTQGLSAVRPTPPGFSWNKEIEVGNLKIKVTWISDLVRPGSYFFVKYRRKGEARYETTAPEMNKDFTYISSLDLGQVYEFVIVVIDSNNHVAESMPQDVDTYGLERPGEILATAGWLIGMLLAIKLILIFFYVVKWSRGGKYKVHEQPDEASFFEYSQLLGARSTACEPKTGLEILESDEDSIPEYVEENIDGYNEDGSFISQYGRNRRDPLL